MLMAARAEEALLSVCTGLALLVTGLLGICGSRPGCTSWGGYSPGAPGKTLAPCPLPEAKLRTHSRGEQG